MIFFKNRDMRLKNIMLPKGVDSQIKMTTIHTFGSGINKLVAINKDTVNGKNKPWI